MEITPSLIVSMIALGISGISLYWAFKSWKETHRPLITARVTTHDAGNVATMLNLVVSNTGNRPAKNVILTVNRNDLASALFAGSEDPLRRDVEHCFSDLIAVIPNGSSVSNSFGCFSANDRDRTWREPIVINITIKYEDLDGRTYENDQPLRVRGGADEAFAGGSWN
ncbi:MAG: hypothetical protein ACLQPD_15385 [Desulfomonilaceae bacterium]